MQREAAVQTFSTSSRAPVAPAALWLTQPQALARGRVASGRSLRGAKLRY